MQSKLSTCGKCKALMDLKEVGETRVLHCYKCKESLSLPPKGDITAHTQICPYCQYQALTFFNPEKQKSHTLCPYCFSKPPNIEEADTFVNGFRCFNCSNTNCPLAKSMTGGVSMFYGLIIFSKWYCHARYALGPWF